MKKTIIKECGQPPEARDSLQLRASKDQGSQMFKHKEWNPSNNPNKQETDSPQGPPESNTGERNIVDQ